jgi:hypothetical protein
MALGTERVALPSARNINFDSPVSLCFNLIQMKPVKAEPGVTARRSG